MLFKSTVALLSTVLAHVAASKGVGVDSLGHAAEETSQSENVEAWANDAATVAGRRLKKDKQEKTKDKQGNKDKGNDKDESNGKEQDDEEEDGGSEQKITPVVRTFARDGDLDWNHGSYAVSSARSGTIEIYVPDGTEVGLDCSKVIFLVTTLTNAENASLPLQIGDTIFMFLSRTDGYLPLELDHWERGAECFKSNNRQEKCLTADDCDEEDGQYCLRFRQGGQDAGTGRDLGTVLFYRHVTEDDPGCWTFELPGRTTTWATVTVVSNVVENKPIVSVKGVSCDRRKQSLFPSVYGKENDVLLLSQCFDDTAMRSDFLPPVGTDRLGWTRSYDEAGFLFGKRLDEEGPTGELITRGPGAHGCKDALLSVVVNREYVHSNLPT
ncbi:hypothetical protein ACHAWF_010393 [Thalassiosira exigua]